MYFSISSTKIVGMEQTGYVSKIYDTGNYKLHHDYIFDGNNNLLVLASEKNAKTSEDKIIMIEKNPGILLRFSGFPIVAEGRFELSTPRV